MVNNSSVTRCKYTNNFGFFIYFILRIKNKYETYANQRSSIGIDFDFIDGKERVPRLLPADGNELLRLVEVEPAVAAHLDVNEDIGLSQLGHQQGVLTNHYRTDARKHRIVVEFEVIGYQSVEYLLR